MKVCPNCGEKVYDNTASECYKCGADISTVAVESRKVVSSPTVVNGVSYSSDMKPKKKEPVDEKTTFAIVAVIGVILILVVIIGTVAIIHENEEKQKEKENQEWMDRTIRTLSDSGYNNVTNLVVGWSCVDDVGTVSGTFNYGGYLFDYTIQYHYNGRYWSVITKIITPIY